MEEGLQERPRGCSRSEEAPSTTDKWSTHLKNGLRSWDNSVTVKLLSCGVTSRRLAGVPHAREWSMFYAEWGRWSVLEVEVEGRSAEWEVAIGGSFGWRVRGSESRLKTSFGQRYRG